MGSNPILSRDEHGAPFAAAFHAEQAVEKALKALLVWHAVDYPPKHDLGLLQALLPAGLGTTSLDVGGLTVYAVELRHVAGASSPMDLHDRPGWAEADQAIELAGQALAVIAAGLAAGGWAP